MRHRATKVVSIATRVAQGAAWSAILGGFLAALIAMFTLDKLVEDHGDRRLRGATDTLAGELDEERKENDDSLDEILDDENAEIVTSGIRLAVYQNGQLISGERWAPFSPPGSCEMHGVLGSRVRSCSRHYGEWQLVAAQKSDRRALRVRFLLAGLAALLIGAGIALYFSRRFTRWAVTPLLELSRQLERSDPEALNPTPVDSKCTEVQAIQVALSDLMGRVQVLLSHTQRFAAEAAHELRTPLAALRVELELLSEGPERSERDPEADDGAAEARLLSALKRVDHLTSLVDRLLLLSSPTKELRSAFEAVALGDLVREVIEALSDEHRRRVEVACTQEGLVLGDPSLLQTMLRNAVDNALKFSEAQVDLCLTEKAGQVVVEVADKGPGVPLALRKRVFDPFFRERANVSQGHGLGLALIGHIAEVHQGEAEFVDVEQGARLVMTIPRWNAEKARKSLERQRR